MGADSQARPLNRTPLYEFHLEFGAKMVPFAGYEMPVHYPQGVLKEHLHTRAQAGLFDVSHMGQAFLIADDRSHDTAARALETLVPADILNLEPGRQRYTQLLDDTGGTIDDLMVTRSTAEADDGGLMLIVNASRKHFDYAHMTRHLPAGVRITPTPERALLALQGPAAQAVIAELSPQATRLGFMQGSGARLGPFDCHLSRSGYTGEDGFEVSVKADKVVDMARLLLADPRVRPIGLGARDSLRLEAGLCLYGHELDATTSPIEAGLAWSIQERRRRTGGFPGAARIRTELAEGPSRRRVGIRPEGRAPAREGTGIVAPSGEAVGIVTSGGFGPTVNGPIAMGYVAAAHSAPGTSIQLLVRGKALPATVVPLPFVPHRYGRANVRSQ